MSLSELREMYGADFNPEEWSSPYHPFSKGPDSSFYFTTQDWNRGDIERINGIDTVFNRIRRVGADSTLFSEADSIWGKFGVYEITVDNLLPSQPYYVSVTAFDFGNRSMLSPLESSPLSNAVMAYPLYTSDRVAQEKLKAIVWPNPYKISDDYRGRGYEDRDRTGWSERSRRVHFANLPERATIRIFTLDGDLIRQIDHEPGGVFSETSSTAWWDLISKNTQAVVSGIYLYAIESALETQVGKIVIIK
jgi:hypothetical protein